jgi:hypothetical protein
MRPRIIHSDEGTFDASKVSCVSQIYQYNSGSYYFRVHTENQVEAKFSMNEFGKLQEFRRRLIGFVWPNADVFDPSKNDTAS